MTNFSIPINVILERIPVDVLLDNIKPSDCEKEIKNFIETIIKSCRS